MALAHSQIYSFYHWKQAYNGVSRDVTQWWWYHMKEAFVAAGWTVMGSYAAAGSAFNDGDRDLVDGLGAGAGTDTWVTKMPNNTGKPWVVLQCPPIMGVMQIMFSGDQPLSGNPEYWQVDVSPLGQFMALYGGVNGGLSGVPPTAPDSHNHYNNINSGLSNTGSYSMNLHACWSADKSQFFLMVNQEAANSQFIAFSVLENAHVGLQNGLVWTVNGNGNNIIASDSRLDNEHYTGATWRGFSSGAVRTFYLGGRGYANSGLHNQVRIPEDGKTIVGPCELYMSSLTLRGYYGRVPDLYWGPTGQFRQGFGDAIGGPINWFSGGNLILPWDNAEPLPRVR